MFYWFFKTTHFDGHLNRPIVLWLQGGPGLSGTGHGNFLMFGPLNENLTSREVTWIETVNVLFVDSPVGSGFSVVDDLADIPDNIEQISLDLISMLQVFMAEHPFYRNSPFYIFGQSYGGKMTTALSYYLHQAIEQTDIKCNLKGAGIGNGFVSPTDIIVNWAPMLYQMSIIDDTEFEKLSAIAQEAWEAGEHGDWEAVKRIFTEEFEELNSVAQFMNFYNIIEPYNVQENESEAVSQPELTIYDVNITSLMNGPVREKLGIIPDQKIWGDLLDEVYMTQFNSTDMFKPVWELVDNVLKSSDIDIIIYQGQLDIICDTSGVLRWMQRLTWSGKPQFDLAKRKALTTPGTNRPEMFVKSYDNLKMYWVLNSGHAVPADVPDVALRMLNRILNDTD